MTKSLLTQRLKTNDLRVVFTKADGSERTLLATRHIPIEETLKSIETSFDSSDNELPPKPRKPLSDELWCVWEIGNGWRTIKIDSIKEVTDL